MKYSIKIKYPFEKMEENKKRMTAYPTYKYADRVPVQFCIEPRYFTPLFGLEYNEIFKDVETQYYLQLQFAKHQIENIPSDGFCQAPTIWVHPYFDNVCATDACGGNIQWLYNQVPQAMANMKDMGDMDKFKIPDPEAGLFGKKIRWWHRMNELVKETEVMFNGQKGEVKVLPLTLNHLDPFNIAYDLVGGDFYWWILEEPERCHEFLRKITTGLILAERNIRRIDPRKREFYMLANDPSQVKSPELYIEFTVPYTKMMFDEFGKGCIDGRGIHMCGRSAHLHEALINELHMTSFDLFGYQVAPEVVAKNLGGKCLLWGNINPMLMLTGTREEVKKEAMRALEALAPCGGLLLGDGANVCPGTPIENLAVLTEASEENAKAYPELFNTWSSANFINDSDERNITNLS